VNEISKIETVAKEMGLSTSDSFKEFVELNNPARNSVEKKIITRKLDIKGDGAKLIPIADPHIGSKNADLHALDNMVNFIKKSDDTYTVLLGDMAENATKVSVGMGMFEEDFHLEDQIEYIIDLLKPLADQGKILGIQDGNHEYRTACLTGLKPMSIVAKSLGIPFLGHQGFISLDISGINYQLMTYHGAGSGRLIGGKANASTRGATIAPLMDVYLSGHSHVKHVHEEMRYFIEDGELKSKKQHYIVCGSYLSYFGGYAEMQLLTPSSTGAVCINFYKDRKNISVLM